MTCPNCKCPECRAAAVNAVLRRVAVPREIESANEYNKALRELNAEKEAWGDTVVTLDPDAEQLAGDVVREMARVG